MTLPIWIVAGIILGAIAGSFIGTLTQRWGEGRTLCGRSCCDGCGATLRVFELIPIFSFGIQKGRCRRCGAAIGTRQLVTECILAAIGGAALGLAPGTEGLSGALFGWVLLTLSILDTEHFWLPDRLNLVLATSGLAFGGGSLADRVLGALGGFAALTLVRLGYRALRHRDGMGGGDPKLLAGIGAWLGWAMLPWIVFGASVIGLILVLIKRMRGGIVLVDDQLPFGALMAVTAFPLWLLMMAGWL
jgi:leader peptidase (prepilin peptidase) / N-methyltransferase